MREREEGGRSKRLKKRERKGREKETFLRQREKVMVGEREGEESSETLRERGGGQRKREREVLQVNLTFASSERRRRRGSFDLVALERSCQQVAMRLSSPGKCYIPCASFSLHVSGLAGLMRDLCFFFFKQTVTTGTEEEEKQQHNKKTGYFQRCK